MLRYIKLSVLMMFLLVLMSCPAPTTVSGRVPGLPEDISDIINTGSSKFWSGRKDGASNLIYLYNQDSTWKITIKEPGRPKSCVYVTTNSNSNVGADNKWSARFTLADCAHQKEKNANAENKEELELTMMFTTPRAAQVTLNKVNEVTNSKCPSYQDYGTFRMSAM